MPDTEAKFFEVEEYEDGYVALGKSTHATGSDYQAGVAADPVRHHQVCRKAFLQQFLQGKLVRFECSTLRKTILSFSALELRWSVDGVDWKFQSGF